ncbi:hypothetical protein Trydic_g9711 [Trypoxylus dichotomus]
MEHSCDRRSSEGPQATTAVEADLLQQQDETDASNLIPMKNTVSAITIPLHSLVPPMGQRISELRSMIATMDKKKSPGYDNIMLADVIGTLDGISPALVRLINLSLRNAVIPSLLKVAVVTPIYKNGKKDAYTNYRPISVLSCIDKIIEKYVAKVMHDYLQKYQVLNESQYGYRKNRGTIDLLERVADIVNGKLNEHKHVLCLFIDFSKAFDRINHDKLLKILEDLGIRGPLLDWFRCFLANRRFCVKVGNEVSSLRELRAGVPQGSILGPLLYLLYVNDVQHCFQDCKCFLYADDTLILAVHKDIKKAEQMLLREFHRFQLWAHQKDLLINTSKTKLMHVASPHSGVDCDLKLTVHDTDCLHMEDTNHNRNCECDNIIELVHRQNVQLPKILNDLPETMLNLQSLAQVKANLRSWLVSLDDEIKFVYCRMQLGTNCR